ncbi:MAG: dihydrofolate reductase [Epulopiscium sp.]|nr:dihydrofolate reductase [Candidatus Epulonipiscium sp.]
MNIIVSVDKNWGIGCRGNLLKRVPEDMKQFREKTLGKVVIMGRRTFESLPNSKPLKDRTNIIITKNKDYKVEGANVCNSLEEFLEMSKGYKQEDVFIIGGESIYRALLKYCSKAYVTKFHKGYTPDTFFPNLDKEKTWKKISESAKREYEDLEFIYTVYENTFTVQL